MRDNILVKWSAILMDVSIRSKRIRSCSTHLQRAKYLMSMCQVQLVGFCALAIAVHPALSSYATVAGSCGTSRSHRMLRTKKHIQLTSVAAMNSALVDERATVGWNFVLNAIVLPAC